MNYKYLVVKIASIENGRLFNKKGLVILPTIYSYSYKEEWEYFIKKYKGEFEIIPHYKDKQYSSQGRVEWGNEISELKIGSPFIISSHLTKRLRTSLVQDIISNDIFITYNSVYIIINKQKELREKKLNELLCQNLKKSGQK